MRVSLTTVCLITLVVAGPVAAAPRLSAVMNKWKAVTRMTNDMLLGHASFDEVVVRVALQNYVDNAAEMVAQADGEGAMARDFRLRFFRLQSNAKTALGHLARLPALKADFARITAECQACHDAYND